VPAQRFCRRAPTFATHALFSPRKGWNTWSPLMASNYPSPTPLFRRHDRLRPAAIWLPGHGTRRNAKDICASGGSRPDPRLLSPPPPLNGGAPPLSAPLPPGSRPSTVKKSAYEIPWVDSSRISRKAPPCACCSKTRVPDPSTNAQSRARVPLHGGAVGLQMRPKGARKNLSS